MLLSDLKLQNDDEAIIDTAEEEQLMMDNLEKEADYLMIELKEVDRRHAREVKAIQEEIKDLRVSILQK